MIHYLSGLNSVNGVAGRARLQPKFSNPQGSATGDGAFKPYFRHFSSPSPPITNPEGSTEAKALLRKPFCKHGFLDEKQTPASSHSSVLFDSASEMVKIFHAKAPCGRTLRI